MGYRQDAKVFHAAMESAGVKPGSRDAERCVAMLDALSLKGGGNPADFVRSVAGPKGAKRSTGRVRREIVSNLQEMGLLPGCSYFVLWIVERLLMRVLWKWIESVITETQQTR